MLRLDKIYRKRHPLKGGCALTGNMYDPWDSKNW